MSARGALAAHLLASFALVALTYNATSQEWVGVLQAGLVADSLIRKWLLFALALANLAAAFVAAGFRMNARDAGPPASSARGGDGPTHGSAVAVRDRLREHRVDLPQQLR